mmetsp:Transcript_1533/g.2322  ORF Transcript_1533/g.2322 Transcript_1533/m.2322 type:complete len:333 (-) Transcript_1533:1766-2764(-)
MILNRVLVGLDGEGCAYTKGLIGNLMKLLTKPCGDGTMKSRQITCSDVLELSVFQLMSMLDVSFNDANEVLLVVASSVAPKFETALQVLKSNAEIETTLPILGLERGHIIEVVGRAGVGKTQMCLTNAVDVAFKQEQCVVYIDTENKFSVERVIQIIESRLGRDREGVREIAQRIIVLSPRSPQQLLSMVGSLDNTMVEKKVGLLIVDSVAGLSQLGCRSGHEMIKRQHMLSKLASKLKFLAETCHVPVLVTNQVTYSLNDRPMPQDATELTFVETRPALGNTWAHAVNIRVAFETTHDGSRRRAKIIKSPTHPDIECLFLVEASGIVVDST